MSRKETSITIMKRMTFFGFLFSFLSGVLIMKH